MKCIKTNEECIRALIVCSPISEIRHLLKNNETPPRAVLTALGTFVMEQFTILWYNYMKPIDLTVNYNVIMIPKEAMT